MSLKVQFKLNKVDLWVKFWRFGIWRAETLYKLDLLNKVWLRCLYSMYSCGKSLNLDVWHLCKEIKATRNFMSIAVLDCAQKKRRRWRRRRRRQIAALEISAQSQHQQFCLWGRIGAAVIIQHHSSPPLLPAGFRLDPLRVWEFTTHPSSLYLRALRMLVISGARSTTAALAEPRLGLLCNPGTENVLGKNEVFTRRFICSVILNYRDKSSLN